MKSDEINDLYDYGYKIVQNSDYFKFSLDSIILADFVKMDFKDKNVIDLCTGNAPIPIVLSKNNVNIWGMEIQKEIYDLAVKSVKINNLNNINIINDDIKNWKNYFPGNNFDIVTCNPPYFKYTEKSIVNNNMIKTIARHELATNLEEVIKISEDLLRAKGKLYLVFRSERLIELTEYLSKYHFGIKRLQCVYNDQDSNCSMILIEAKKNCENNVIITKPIFSNKYRGDI